MIIVAIIRKKELKNITNEDIDNKLEELRLELSKQLGSVEIGGTVKSPGKIKEMKKTIARLLTIKAQRIKNKKIKYQKRLKIKEEKNE